jgi:hypothetical protein
MVDWVTNDRGEKIGYTLTQDERDELKKKYESFEMTARWDGIEAAERIHGKREEKDETPR